jgi:hypothetical protein
MIFHIEAGQPGTRGEKHSTTGTSLIQFAIEMAIYHGFTH